GVVHRGYWNDIGGLDAYRRSNLDVAEGLLASIDAAEDGLLIADSAQVAADAHASGPCVVGPAARVAAEAHVAESLLLPGARIASGDLVVAGTVGTERGLRDWVQRIGV